MKQQKNLEKSNRTRRKKLQLGDIYEIPLPNGNKAYGRLYKECTLAIYKLRGNSIKDIDLDGEYECFIGVYKDLLQDGVWPIVGKKEFLSEDDAWAPPKCVIDAITGKGSLYYKGIITPCTYEECKDLEVVSAWDRHHVVDQLSGIKNWKDLPGKPKP